MGIPICGPKLSMCCTLMSVWGIVMLVLLGGFMRLRSPAFIEDLPIDEEQWAEKEYSTDYVYGLYDQASNNCFIAAGLYVVTFFVSGAMWQINNKRNYAMT